MLHQILHYDTTTRASLISNTAARSFIYVQIVMFYLLARTAGTLACLYTRATTTTTAIVSWWFYLEDIQSRDSWKKSQKQRTLSGSDRAKWQTNRQTASVVLGLV